MSAIHNPDAPVITTITIAPEMFYARDMCVHYSPDGRTRALNRLADIIDDEIIPAITNVTAHAAWVKCRTDMGGEIVGINITKQRWVDCAAGLRHVDIDDADAIQDELYNFYNWAYTYGVNIVIGDH